MTRRICKQPGCERNINAVGWCGTHYKRHRTGGDMDAPIRTLTPGRGCSIKDCGRSHFGLGYCNAHYKRHKKGADMDAPIFLAEARFCAISGCVRPHHARLNHYERDRSGRDMRDRIPRSCLVKDCDRPHRASGFCTRHYSYYLRTGRVPVKLTYVPSVHDECSASAAHMRVKAMWGSASQYPCVDCDFDAEDWAYDGTDTVQLYGLKTESNVFYSRYPEFYMPLCKRCHSRRDKGGTAKELRQYRIIRHEFGLTPDEMYELCRRFAWRLKSVNEMRRRDDEDVAS